MRNLDFFKYNSHIYHSFDYTIDLQLPMMSFSCLFLGPGCQATLRRTFRPESGAGEILNGPKIGPRSIDLMGLTHRRGL